MAFFPSPLNPVASDLTQGLQVFAAGGVVRQKIYLCTAGQVFDPFFEAQDGKGAYQTDGVDLVYLRLISQGERSRRWFVRPTTSQTG